MIATVCYAGISEAQVANDNPPAWFASVHPDLTGFQYPALARQARIMGPVRFVVSPGSSKISDDLGHPLLVAAARQNLERWHYDPPLTEPIVVEYVFRLTEPVTTTHRVLRGDAFDRFFLRIFKQPVYRDEHECDDTHPTTLNGPGLSDKGDRRLNVLVSTTTGCYLGVAYSQLRRKWF
jgi:hypothetical protein